MSTSSSNSWLRGQRKSDLVEVADHVGLTKYAIYSIHPIRDSLFLLLRASLRWNDVAPRPTHPAPSLPAHSTPHPNDIADSPPSFESLKKVELEVALDRYLTQNSPSFSADPRVAGFFQSQAKARGSPVKKEAPDDADRALRSVKRRSTRAPEDFSPE